jgi:hypothetical protein
LIINLINLKEKERTENHSDKPGAPGSAALATNKISEVPKPGAQDHRQLLVFGAPNLIKITPNTGGGGLIMLMRVLDQDS